MELFNSKSFKVQLPGSEYSHSNDSGQPFHLADKYLLAINLDGEEIVVLAENVGVGESFELEEMQIIFEHEDPAYGLFTVYDYKSSDYDTESLIENIINNNIDVTIELSRVLLAPLRSTYYITKYSNKKLFYVEQYSSGWSGWMSEKKFKKEFGKGIWQLTARIK